MAQKIVIASTREEAGKTSIIIGLAKALSNKKIGYMKPFGDRLLYQKKRLWDYDAALITSIIGLEDRPEEISLGFAHSKLRYMYNEETTKEKVNELLDQVCLDKDIVFIEGSRTLSHGHSVFLDPLTIAKNTGAKLVIILSGDEDLIIDDITFLKNFIKTNNIKILGVIINGIKDIKDFKDIYLKRIEDLGINIIGIIPYKEEMTYYSIEYLYQTLMAKVIAGEGGLKKLVKNIFVGAMSSSQVVHQPLWAKDNKLIITGGDRTDMILTALESNTSGIILTNNILPDDPIITSKANSSNIPLLSVPTDTFKVAKQIDNMETLFTKEETDKINLLEQLVKDNIDLTLFHY